MSGMMGDICNICGHSDWAGHKCELKYDKDRCINLLIEGGNILMYDLINTKDELIKKHIKDWVKLVREINSGRLK
jgi:hypothetical protein